MKVMRLNRVFNKNLNKQKLLLAGGLVLAGGFCYYLNEEAEASDKSKYHGIVIFGAPGSGKGTQSELIVQNFGHVHFSTGDILRAEVRNGTELGKLAKGYMDAGGLVPDNVMIGMISSHIKGPEPKKHGWLLDGMPRTAIQASALDEMGCQPNLVISLNVPDEVLLERICGRREDPVTKKIYHMTFNPPPSDIVGRLTQRSDDTPEKFKVRLQAFHDQSAPIISHYEKQGKVQVLKLDGTKNKNEVFKIISDKLKE